MKDIAINEIGNRYGMLVVIDRANNIGSRVGWLCKCDCGNTKIIAGTSLRSGGTTSCGCKRGKREYGEASLNRLYINYKHNAINRGYSFEISKELFRKLTKENCYYCGKEPEQITKGKSNNGEYIYNGIDRVDPQIGYTNDNVVSCCKQCNHAKNNFSKDDFLNWIEKVYKIALDRNEKI